MGYYLRTWTRMTLFLLEFLVLGRRHCRYICHRKDIKWQMWYCKGCRIAEKPFWSWPRKRYYQCYSVNDDKESEAKSLGFSEEGRRNYSEMDYVREELKFAPRIFAQNPVWSVSDNLFQFSNVQLNGNFKDMLVIDSWWCFLLVCDCRSDRKAIEETSAVILRIYHDRQHKCSTPRITKRC